MNIKQNIGKVTDTHTHRQNILIKLHDRQGDIYIETQSIGNPYSNIDTLKILNTLYTIVI